MKKIIQLSLFSLIVLIGIFFYNEYFLNIDTPEKKNLESTENFLSNEKSNIIKNLRYDVSLDNNTKYNITSDFSELIYIDGTELVKMQNVVAIFIDENNVPLIIKSENAIFNNTTYNTNFSNNVKIRYLDNIIDSNKLDLNLVYKELDFIRRDRSLSKRRFAEIVVSMVQNIPYNIIVQESCSLAQIRNDSVNEMILRGYECEGNVYAGVYSPLEFVKKMKGDCDSRTLFIYTVLKKFNYDVCSLNHWLKHTFFWKI